MRLRVGQGGSWVVRMSAGRGSLLKLGLEAVGEKVSSGGEGGLCLQVWDVDCCSDRAGEVVGEQSVVAEFPAEEVRDEEDRRFRRRACHVGLIRGCWEGDRMSGWLAIPFKPCDAALRYGHAILLDTEASP